MEIPLRLAKAIRDAVPEKERQAFLSKAIEKGLEERRAVHATQSPLSLFPDREPSATGGKTVDVFVDGGSRGNPGPAGGGFAILRGGKVIKKGGEFFGRLTNNQAEYLALRLALRETFDLFSDSAVRCFMDSELVVRQMNGDYKVKNAALKPLHEEVRRIADQFKKFTLSHIPREENALADRMANHAMDRGR